MQTAGLLVARTRARVGLLIGLVATVLVATATLVGLFGWLSVTTHEQLTETIASGDSAKVVQTRLPDGAEAQGAQAAEASELFAELFGDTAVIERTVTPEPEVRVLWTITAQAEGLDSGRLAQLHSGLDRLQSAVADSGISPRGAVFEGTLDEKVAAASQGIGAVDAIAPVPLLLAAALGWIALIQLARLLGSARAGESELLIARGLSPRQSSVFALGESAFVALVGVVLGAAVAVAVLAGIAGARGLHAALSAWPVTAATFIIAAATMAVAARRASRGITERSLHTGRAARLAAISTSLLVVLAAGVFIWQLQLHGATPATGAIWEQAVTALAPTLALAAGAVIALVLFGPLSALWARMLVRTRGLAPLFPARQVARRTAAFAVALVLVTVSVGGAVLAAAYAGTWASIDASAGRVEVGADVRAILPGDTVTPQDIIDAKAVQGITAAAPGDTAQVSVGDVAATLVALPASGASQVIAAVPADPTRLAAAIASSEGDPSAIELPEGTTGLQAEIELLTRGLAEYFSRVDVRLWLSDASGTTVSVPMTFTITDNDARLVTADAVIPPGTAPWSFIGITAEQLTSYYGVNVAVRLASVDAVTGSLTAEPQTTVPLTLDHPGATLELQHPDRRGVLWNVTAEVVPAPGVISTALAQRLAIGVGDTFDPIYQGTGRTARIVVRDVVDVIPGAPQEFSVLTSLEGLAASSLVQNMSIRGASEVWAAGSPAAAPALAEAVGANSVRTTQAGSASMIANSLLTVWWAGVAAGILLALVALAAIVAEQASSRRAEVGLLRALGVPRRLQARMRSAELVGVFALGVVLGAVLGFVAATLVIPDLAAAAVPGAPAAVAANLTLEPLPLGIAAAALIGGLLLICGVQARAVARQATVALPGAETR